MATTTYEEFEPFCKWQKEQGMDTLELHLQGFKKEELRVQLNNLGVMRISGEREVDGPKRTRFQKEISVGKDVKTNEIRAKFSNGILYITMPKQTPQTPLQTQQITFSPKSQENEPKIPKMGPEALPKKTENIEFVLKLPINRRMALCVTAAFALLVAIGIFLMYFRPSNFKM